MDFYFSIFFFMGANYLFSLLFKSVCSTFFLFTIWMDGILMQTFLIFVKQSTEIHTKLPKKERTKLLGFQNMYTVYTQIVYSASLIKIEKKKINLLFVGH